MVRPTRGQVIGLAPSAAAAAVLGEQTGIRTDTLAKLTSLDQSELADWAVAVGPSTLVIIDEAGMADTLSLDTVVQFAIDRGANVRLIGDDQQPAAIGAGGVLRDIQPPTIWRPCSLGASQRSPHYGDARRAHPASPCTRHTASSGVASSGRPSCAA